MLTDEDLESYAEREDMNPEDLGEEDLEDLLEAKRQEEKRKKKKWSIVFSKKPELIIEKEEYDRILIDLLQSYADYKQTTINMEDLVEIEDEQIIQNTENRRKTRRNPSQIRKVFDKVYMKYIDQSVRINDVKFKYDQFVEYVIVVSNHEIALIHGGDNSKLKKYLKELWKKLSEEHKLIELTIKAIEKDEKKAKEEKDRKDFEDSIDGLESQDMIFDDDDITLEEKWY